jgi:hypothetical protein
LPQLAGDPNANPYAVPQEFGDFSTSMTPPVYE